VWRGTSEIWVKPLADGGKAVLLLNRGEAPADIAVTWEQLGILAGQRLRVRDLWLHRDLPRARGRYETSVAPHAIVMLRVRP
jgi:alpha-galactosidase